MKRVLALCFLLIVICSTSFAFKNEPDSFKGFKLNSSIEEVSSFQLLKNKYYTEEQQKIDDNLCYSFIDEYCFDLVKENQALYDIPFYLLWFRFYQNNLYSIETILGIPICKDDNDKKLNMAYFRKLEYIMTELYGSPTSIYPEKLKYNDSYMRLEWRGVKSIITLRWMWGDSVYLTIKSAALEKEIKDDLYKKALAEWK